MKLLKILCFWIWFLCLCLLIPDFLYYENHVGPLVFLSLQSMCLSGTTVSYIVVYRMCSFLNYRSFSVNTGSVVHHCCYVFLEILIVLYSILYSIAASQNGIFIALKSLDSNVVWLLFMCDQRLCNCEYVISGELYFIYHCCWFLTVCLKHNWLWTNSDLFENV